MTAVRIGMRRGAAAWAVFALTMVCANAHAQVLENFAWVDLKADTQIVALVTKALKDRPYTALREIGVAGEQALVVTAARKKSVANPGSDMLTIYGVGLKSGSVQELIEGTHLRYVEWQKFYDSDTPELIALYDDCADCQTTTFLTAFYLDRSTKQWGARWPRQVAGAPLTSSNLASDYVYAAFRGLDERVVVDTWVRTPPQVRGTRATEVLYEYKIDPMSARETSRPLTGRDAADVKQRLCKPVDPVFGLAGGQDSAACKAPKTAPRGELPTKAAGTGVMTAK
jgi:hypothetical protein